MDLYGHPVDGVERALQNGHLVRVHKICSTTFDADMAQAKLTAQQFEAPWFDPAEGGSDDNGR